MNAQRPAAPAEALPDDLPFERAMEQLEEIVRRLERGEALKRHCEALLKRAEARIQTIAVGPDGRAAGTAPLDVE